VAEIVIISAKTNAGGKWRCPNVFMVLLIINRVINMNTIDKISKLKARVARSFNSFSRDFLFLESDLRERFLGICVNRVIGGQRALSANVILF
jgi:hypothetical protein